MGPGDLTLWAVVLLAVAVATSMTIGSAERTWLAAPPTPARLALRLVVTALALVVLALLWTGHAVADADAGVLHHLDASRNTTLAAILTVVTTMGDAIPSLTIAVVLALVVERQGRHRVVCWVLPVVVLAQLFVQFALPKAISTLTIADLAPELVSGGSGYLPSGSVARLTSVFLVAALLLHSTSPRAARAVVTLGGVLVVVEAMTRLYLGRHLLVDVAGGLLLGSALFLLVRIVLLRVTPATVESQRRH